MTTTTAKTMTKKTAKPLVKAKAKVSAKKVSKPKKAPAPQINAHIEAGVDTKQYAGLSSMINKNRKTKIAMVDPRPEGKMTDRLQKSLYALRKAYEGRSFGCKGFDNGIIRDLAATKLIALSGGQQTNIDGSPYLMDAELPVTAKITAAGKKYGTTAPA